ncbi:MAG: hypothetical protein CMF61_06315 [Magnetococcales bacterium]|nr:hypothetical protein [Magnetococcales bacterium]PPR19323.1 MAG: hypothetical protein CFH43_00250 [Pseudomonadota bacterium]|tara:strand:+ start:42 stop:395 length:354 start_codon:yes stop_codon:yes gene_type:complete
MKPQQVFVLNHHYGKLFIAEETLKPTSHFTPEDKNLIAATHAEHIQMYLNSGMRPTTQILLCNDSTYCGFPSKTTTITLESGKEIDIQTIFSHYSGQIPHATLNSHQFLTLKKNMYV